MVVVLLVCDTESAPTYLYEACLGESITTFIFEPSTMGTTLLLVKLSMPAFVPMVAGSWLMVLSISSMAVLNRSLAIR